MGRACPVAVISCRQLSAQNAAVLRLTYSKLWECCCARCDSSVSSAVLILICGGMIWEKMLLVESQKGMWGEIKVCFVVVECSVFFGPVGGGQ